MPPQEAQLFQFRLTTSDSAHRSYPGMYHHTSCTSLSLSIICHWALIPFLVLRHPWVPHACENRLYNGPVNSLSFEMICREKHHSPSPWAGFVLLLLYCSWVTGAPRGSGSPAHWQGEQVCWEGWSLSLIQMVSPDKIEKFSITKAFLQVHTWSRAWSLWSSVSTLLGRYICSPCKAFSSISGSSQLPR